jgi:hypothetical protein
VEIFQIVRSEHMAAEGDPLPETNTNLIVEFLPVPVPPKKKEKIKGWEECEMLEEVLLAFQVLKLTGDSGSNPEQDEFFLSANNVTR